MNVAGSTSTPVGAKILISTVHVAPVLVADMPKDAVPPLLTENDEGTLTLLHPLDVCVTEYVIEAGQLPDDESVAVTDQELEFPAKLLPLGFIVKAYVHAVVQTPLEHVPVVVPIVHDPDTGVPPLQAPVELHFSPDVQALLSLQIFVLVLQLETADQLPSDWHVVVPVPAQSPEPQDAVLVEPGLYLTPLKSHLTPHVL